MAFWIMIQFTFLLLNWKYNQDNTKFSSENLFKHDTHFI